MAETLEERVAYLEGKAEEQSRLGSDVRERLVQLDQKVDRFRIELTGRIDTLDQRLSSRIDALDQKVDRFRIELTGRIDVLDQKISTQFRWLVGLMVTVLLAVIGALLKVGG